MLSSISLIWRITSFRLIELPFFPIVKCIEGGRVGPDRITQVIETDPKHDCGRSEIELKHKVPIGLPQPEEESVMSILSTISRLAQEYSEARVRYLTERSINALPLELQKDIGSRRGTRS